MTNLPLSCADYPEILEPQTPGYFRASPGLYEGCFTYRTLRIKRVTAFTWTTITIPATLSGIRMPKNRALKVRHCVLFGPPLVSILKQSNPAHGLPLYYFTIKQYFYYYFFVYVFPSGLIFPIALLHFLFSPVFITCSA